MTGTGESTVSNGGAVEAKKRFQDLPVGVQRLIFAVGVLAVVMVLFFVRQLISKQAETGSKAAQVVEEFLDEAEEEGSV